MPFGDRARVVPQGVWTGPITTGLLAGTVHSNLSGAMLVLTRTRDVNEFVSIYDSDRWTQTLATTHSEYPLSKLKTDNLDDYARTWGQRQSHSTFSANYTIGLSKTWYFDAISLLGINRRVPDAPGIVPNSITSNQARLIIDTVPKNAFLPEVTPATFSLTNLTGTYDVLNQIINPPEEELSGGYSPSALEATSNSSNTAVTMQFNNEASRPLLAGADQQTIMAHVRDSVDIDTFPTISATLRQAGSDVTSLSVSEIEKTSEGYILIYRWDAALLPNLTDLVGLRLNGTTTGSSTPEYISVTWRAEVSGAYYDTDWQDLESDDKVVWAPGIELTSSSFHVLVQLSDLSGRASISIPGAPAVQQYVYYPVIESLHIGRFVGAGSKINAPLRSQSVGGFNLRKWGNNANSLVSSYGGQFRAIRPDMTRWQADLTFIPQSQSRMFGELSRFVDDVGYVLPALYIPNDGLTDPYAQHPHALWAIITSFEAPDLGLLHGNDTSTSLPHTEDKRFDLRMSIIEAHAHLTKRAD